MNTPVAKIATAWAITLIISLIVVKGTSIGKVILVISEKHGMGVHTFDLIIAIPVVLSSIYTIKILSKLTKA